MYLFIVFSDDWVEKILCLLFFPLDFLKTENNERFFSADVRWGDDDESIHIALKSIENDRITSIELLNTWKSISISIWDTLIALGFRLIKIQMLLTSK